MKVLNKPIYTTKSGFKDDYTRYLVPLVKDRTKTAN